MCLHFLSNLNGARSYIICQHMVFILIKVSDRLFRIFSAMNDFPKLKLRSTANCSWLNTGMILITVDNAS